MMTNEQILELVRFHFQEGGLRDDGSCSEYFGTPENFIEFARAIYKMAYEKGNDDGWEDRGIEESSTYSGLFGEPQ